jgi:hypothetical protein
MLYFCGVTYAVSQLMKNLAQPSAKREKKDFASALVENARHMKNITVCCRNFILSVCVV